MADALDQLGHWQDSEQAYKDAEASAPDLSIAYYREGVARLRRGDIARAIEQLEIANRPSPHWADPLKALGDAFSAKKQ